MTVRAVLHTGEEVPLDPALGSTVQEVVDGLTGESLTGSAVPLEGVELRADDGRRIAYRDINAFEQVDSFLP